MKLVKFFDKHEHAENFKNGNIIAKDFKYYRKEELEDGIKDPNEGKTQGGDYVYFISIPEDLGDNGKNKAETEIKKHQERDSCGYIPIVFKDSTGKIYIYGYNFENESILVQLDQKLFRNFTFPNDKPIKWKYFNSFHNEEKHKPDEEKTQSLPSDISVEIYKSGAIFNCYEGVLGNHALIICLCVFEKTVEDFIIENPKKDFFKTKPYYCLINDHTIIEKVFQNIFKPKKAGGPYIITTKEVCYFDDPPISNSLSNNPFEPYIFTKELKFKYQKEYRCAAICTDFSYGIKNLQHISVEFKVEDSQLSEWYSNCKTGNILDLTSKDFLNKF